MHKTIIRIVAESEMFFGTMAFCVDRATATYYLAHTAAAADLQLETIVADRVYRIGSVIYTFDERFVFDIEDVSRLRRRHEQASWLVRQFLVADKHDLEVRLPQNTSYRSLDDRP